LKRGILCNIFPKITEHRQIFETCEVHVLFYCSNISVPKDVLTSDIVLSVSKITEEVMD